jgi:hypothetical protein
LIYLELLKELKTEKEEDDKLSLVFN